MDLESDALPIEPPVTPGAMVFETTNLFAKDKMSLNSGIDYNIFNLRT